MNSTNFKSKNRFKQLGFQFILVSILTITACASEAKENYQKKTAPNTAVPQCSDFLEQIHKKPKHLDFVGCKAVQKHGLAALESEYHVNGVNAQSVETFFVRTARMPKLRYACCGWESSPKNPKTDRLNGSYSVKGNSYDISMSSGEITLGNSRSRWPEIPIFYVNVVRYLESP